MAPINVLEEILIKAGRHPERTAFIHRDEYLTYRELAEDSAAMATWLLERYPGEKSPVVVYGHKEKEMPALFLSCARAGRPYIPLDASLPSERIARILADSGARVILTSGVLPQGLDAGDAIIVHGSAETSSPGFSLQEIMGRYRGRTPGPANAVKPGEDFYIIYTSGSTGQPKGVRITLECLQSFVQWGLSTFGIKGGQVFLNQAPFSFDLSVMDLYLGLACGGTVWCVDRAMAENPRELFLHLPRGGVEVWVSTPSFAEMCLLEKRFDAMNLPTLETFLFCGEVLANDTAKKLKSRFPAAKIYNSYGPTEATVAVTSLEVNEEALSLYPTLPVGYCKADTKIFIVDEDGFLLPDGEKGEIIIAGPSVSPGYWQNPIMTERAFIAEPVYTAARAYRTGDLGYLQDGLLFYCGRKDFQIKLHGYRIELEDIENNLRALSAVENAVVVPMMKDGRCQYLVACIVPSPSLAKVLAGKTREAEFTAAVDLKKKLSQSVPEYMIPRRVVFLDTLPMTVNGKADRKKLEELAGERKL